MFVSVHIFNKKNLNFKFRCCFFAYNNNTQTLCIFKKCYLSVNVYRKTCCELQAYFCCLFFVGLIWVWSTGDRSKIDFEYLIESESQFCVNKNNGRSTSSWIFGKRNSSC